MAGAFSRKMAGPTSANFPWDAIHALELVLRG